MAGKGTHQARTFLPKCLFSNPPHTPLQGPSRPWAAPVLTTPGTRHPTRWTLSDEFLPREGWGDGSWPSGADILCSQVALWELRPLLV